MILYLLMKYHITYGFPASQIRFLAVPDLLQMHYRAAAAAVHILWSPSLSRRGNTPYVVFYHVPDDRVLRTRKRHFAYFPAVVHFRKVVIGREIGSAGNGHPVI